MLNVDADTALAGIKAKKGITVQAHWQLDFFEHQASLQETCQTSVCKPSLDSGWAIIIHHAFLAASQLFLELRESAQRVRLAV